MSKMSNLDLVLDEMITTGQKMIDAATALKEMFSETAPEMSKVETKTKKKEAPAQEAEVKKYSFQEVRGITASINLYAFTSNGNRGIACGLNNLQKIRDGEPLGGKSRTEDDFATEEDDDFLS